MSHGFYTQYSLYYRGELGETAFFIMHSKKWCGLGDHALKIFDGGQVIMYSKKVIGTIYFSLLKLDWKFITRVQLFE